MCLNLSNHQLNMGCYILRMLYMNLMVTAQQNLEQIHNKQRERKPSITLQKVINHKEREQEKKKGTEKNYKNNQKTMNKMAIRIKISIITLNINGLHVPAKEIR